MIDAATVRFRRLFAAWQGTEEVWARLPFLLFPRGRRQFALVGYKGQYICVDPMSKLVMVETALDAPGADYNEEAWTLWSALVDQLG